MGGRKEAGQYLGVVPGARTHRRGAARKVLPAKGERDRVRADQGVPGLQEERAQRSHVRQPVVQQSEARHMREEAG